jgi:hypothetical protein
MSLDRGSSPAARANAAFVRYSLLVLFICAYRERVHSHAQLRRQLLLLPAGVGAPSPDLA